MPFSKLSQFLFHCWEPGCMYYYGKPDGTIRDVANGHVISVFLLHLINDSDNRQMTLDSLIV